MAGEGNWDPMDLVDHGIDFTTDSAVRWWGPWSPSGTWGAAGPAGLRLARILEELAAVDLSGWQGPAARAAGETLTGAAQLARVGG
ncbi:hypothetical protein, partial [Actinomyces polynesiensis]|uniref:hypothetical protein n=1 Tax=Actinomyces polynesiensis TaxID=1325934 RepID=UPI0005BDE969